MEPKFILKNEENNGQNTYTINEQLLKNDKNKEEFQIDSSYNPIKKEKKHKGFVRIFRKCIKKKDEISKNIIQKRFRKWFKQSLIGSKIKQTLMIRISVSREKDYNAHKNKFKMNTEDEEEKPKSVNKRIVNSIDKYQKNNKNQEKKNDVNIQHNIKIYNKDKNNEKNNNFVFAKRINNYKGNNDTRKRNEIRNKLIGINNINLQSPYKNNNYDNFKNIYNMNNLNNNYIQINSSSIKKSNKNNSNYRKIEPLKFQNINTNSKISFNDQKKRYNSSVKNNNNEYSLNNSINYRNNNNIIKINNYSKDKNSSKGFNFRYQDNNTLNRTTPNTYRPYESNNNNAYKTDLSNKTNYNLGSKYIFNTFNINTYQNLKNKYNNINNNSDIKLSYNNYSSKRETDTSYPQLSHTTIKPALKSGVTTVIQHYRGKRRQYDEFDKNSFKK